MCSFLGQFENEVLGLMHDYYSKLMSSRHLLWFSIMYVYLNGKSSGVRRVKGRRNKGVGQGRNIKEAWRVSGGFARGGCS